MMMIEAQLIEPLFACPPAAMMALKMVMSMAGTVMSFVGAQQQASRQKAYQEHQAALIKQAGDRKASATIAQSIQIREATARKKASVERQAAAAQSKAKLSAIEGGVTGLSITHMLEEYEGQKGRYKFALAEEQRLRETELDRVLKDIALGTGQQMHATMQPINQPNALAYGLKFGAGAFDTWNEYKEWDPKSRRWDFKSQV